MRRIDTTIGSGHFLLALFTCLLAGSVTGEVLEIFAGVSESDTGTILRVSDLAPGDDETLHTLSAQPEDINVDPVGGKVYFIDAGTNTVKRSNLNGTSVQTIVPSAGDFNAIGLDLVNGKLYWSDQISNLIRRSNLDGTSAENVVTGVDNATDIAIDPAGGKLYWIDNNLVQLNRANLNGSNVETIATGTMGISLATLALDPAGGKVYWTDLDLGLRRANLDGTGAETLVPLEGVQVPLSIALDVADGRMYWTDFGGRETIQRANLDGSDIQTVHEPDAHPYYVALDATTRTLYWTEFEGTRVSRRTMPKVETVVSGLIGVGGVAVHVTGGPLQGHLYYVEADTDFFIGGVGAIHRSNFDGTGDVELLTNLELPFDIAIDPGGLKMYWTDLFSGIHRADLNGQNAQVIVPGTGPLAIALDLENDKVYWTDVINERVSRANLDGTNVEHRIPNTRSLWGVAVDTEISTILWSHRTGDQPGIFRTSIASGGGVQHVLTPPAVDDPTGIELDLARLDMYFAGDGRLRRSNLNGQNVQDVMLRFFDGFEFALLRAKGLFVYVNFAAGQNQDGTEFSPFDTVAEAVQAVLPGGTIRIAAVPDSQTTETIVIDQHVILEATGGTVRIGAGGARSILKNSSGFVANDE